MEKGTWRCVDIAMWMFRRYFNFNPAPRNYFDYKNYCSAAMRTKLKARFREGISWMRVSNVMSIQCHVEFLYFRFTPANANANSLLMLCAAALSTGNEWKRQRKEFYYLSKATSWMWNGKKMMNDGWIWKMRNASRVSRIHSSWDLFMKYEFLWKMVCCFEVSFSSFDDWILS